MRNIGYYNGRTGLIEEMTVPMNDRALYFGDGVYDATCCKNNVVYLIDDHVDRFFNSAGLLRIKLPYSKQELKDILNSLVKQVDADEKFVYWQASRGTAKRNHLFPDCEPNLYITVTPAPLPDLSKPIKLITLEDTRFLHCNIKTLNLIPSVMAAQAADEAGCDEAVLHRGGRVTECAHSNVSILKDGVFYTAPTDHLILPGIARSRLIRACKILNIPVDETPFTLDTLYNADEVIVSSSSKFCLRANVLDGKPVGGKAPALFKSIQDEVMREFHAYIGV
ncbi:MAG: D-amino acid aminotransferase [Clostridiales bacterium]|nr:D-amino acid aminotransferase [Clostridiales bacterium]